MEGITIERSVKSISFDEKNELCLIRFWPDKGDSDKEIENTWFYTIVKIEKLKLFGGIPEICEIITVDTDLPNKDKFEHVDSIRYELVDARFKPAEFLGLGHYGAKKGLFRAIKYP
jgi:hypothetical protein